jgi:hypothetical protein
MGDMGIGGNLHRQGKGKVSTDGIKMGAKGENPKSEYRNTKPTGNNQDTRYNNQTIINNQNSLI